MHLYAFKATTKKSNPIVGHPYNLNSVCSRTVELETGKTRGETKTETASYSSINKPPSWHHDKANSIRYCYCYIIKNANGVFLLLGAHQKQENWGPIHESNEKFLENIDYASSFPM